MIKDISSAIHQYSLFWKASSLEILPAGSLAHSFKYSFTVLQEGSQLLYKVIEEILLLGEVMDQYGNTAASILHRRSRGTSTSLLSQVAVTSVQESKLGPAYQQQLQSMVVRTGISALTPCKAYKHGSFSTCGLCFDCGIAQERNTRTTTREQLQSYGDGSPYSIHPC